MEKSKLERMLELAAAHKLVSVIVLFWAMALASYAGVKFFDPEIFGQTGLQQQLVIMGILTVLTWAIKFYMDRRKP